ncbi:DnaD domain protein [Weissella confusa]|uniref:DnaD domain protein n=1 Tax=Weissella confusa TaxID=1583 RepID=UPI0021AEBF79|nr:DnaD domain protein [Weissella confusa]MCT0948657.1 DnaD domain protein [Weissella confusa]
MQDTLNNALESNFTRIPNSVIVDPVFNGRRDGAFRAWVLMASKPQGFQFYTEVLARELDISRQAMADRMDYLVEHDYLIKQPYRSSGGQRANAWTVVIPEIAMSIRTNMAQPNMVRTNMAQLDTNKKDPKQEVLINKIDKEQLRTDERIDNFSNRELDYSANQNMSSLSVPNASAIQTIEKAISDNGFDYSTGPYQLKQKQDLLYYITNDGMQPELVAKAIDITRSSGKSAAYYTNGILENWLAQHILTLKQLETFEAQKQGVANKYGDKQKKEIW